MRFREVKLTEGGWASQLTQNTRITPQLVAQVVKVLAKFQAEFNSFLVQQKMTPIEMGPTAGSAAYYERDLKNNPTREYGDIDVNMFIPQIAGLTNNANMTAYSSKIKEFCDKTTQYSTENGTNVIFKMSDKDFVQVDFILSFIKNKEWTKALRPAYNVKGVLCNSLYSSLAEALNLSMGGGHGVQVKLQNGVPVSFKTMKDVVLKTITTDPHNWAVDIVKFFGCTKLSPVMRYPGMDDEVRLEHIVGSIKAIALTLQLNGKRNASELLEQITNIYLAKIQKAVDSSKYDKAATPEAIAKAEQTKKMLASKSKEIAASLLA